MKLTDEQKAVLEGSRGEVMAKVMETVVMFGDIFGAEKLVPVTHKDGHLVTSFGIALMKPLFSTMDKLINAGITTEGKFTVDPRPLDYENVKCNLLEKIAFHVMYKKQADYEEQLKKVGLRDSDSFTCTCYLDEVGNIPAKGDVLSWAESSAVVYANSVLGARCNRNSGMLDLFGSIVGYVPYFGLVTDEGRKAKWKVIVKTTKKPEAQVLGSAIGMKVMEDVPYVVGLDRFLGTELTDDAKAYLKDFGAATASNGAVGLYHIDKLTPEAVEQGESLILPDAKEYIIDDEELERVYGSYPVMWKKPDAKPGLCFIGCPHLSYKQLCDWTDDIEKALEAAGRKKVAVRTIMTTSPQVKKKFAETGYYTRLMRAGVKLTSICPLMYTNNPMTKGRAIVTNSNKLRTYSIARYYKDAEILDVLAGKEVR
ncbi:MAG TPA: aconitase X catalytic domain-containing protein [Candidatus Protoclostridium stercorigallinarum]|uniref:Aconitase X catalytic domain-containing protein n=1 Tax=Candidatus Protoclostridium stercorigallinarum TaxID=2838741 RepID=A0A9D1PZH3_9FIRM|nr:aconitase X catalytic domain-containing protein [Candidatus Protoclostridium stercorigallinarum]